ncbi:MAG: alpha/beta hydrolase, partial [Deinococcota bacterium]
MPRATYSYGPSFPIENRYASWGGRIVTNQTVVDGYGNQLFEVYYPTELQGPYPIVVWGNGTGSLPPLYHELALHMASWGFVYIAPYDENVGNGRSILDAVEFLVDENSNPNSIFYTQINIGRVGAVGTSQGANGVINAHTNYPNGRLISTVVANALPTEEFIDIAGPRDTSRIRAPFVILSGTADELISPIDANLAAARRVPRGVPVMVAMSDGATHIEIEGDGGSFRGYLTAWMAYQLQGDAYAASAFAGANPEIVAHPFWRD